MILNLIFVFCLFIIIMIEVGYPFIVRKISAKKKFTLHENTPDLTVIIPAFNEEQKVEKCIKSIIETDYPFEKKKLIAVDNNSTDNTRIIMNKFPIKVIESSRGKINAINHALKETSTDIVVICDADTWLEKNSLRKIVFPLQGNIGAVSGFPVLEGEQSLFKKSKFKFHEKDFMLRVNESKLYSCCSLDGRLMAFRKTVVEKFPEKAMVDDYELTFLVIKKGFRAIVNEDARVHEQVPGSWLGELRQLRRRPFHGFKISWHYYSFLFNPEYKFFGLMTFPFRRFFIYYIPLYILYIFLFILFKFGLKTLLMIIGILFFYVFITGNTYSILIFIGLCLNLFDLVFRRKYLLPGGVWER